VQEYLVGPFTTERLLLRTMEESDAPILRELIYSDREVWGMYSTLGERPEALARAFRHHCSQDPKSRFGRLVVVLRVTGNPIGQIQLDPYINSYYQVPGESMEHFNAIEVELGFAFGKEYWGQGFASEACKAVIEYAFKDLRLPRLVGGAEMANIRSAALQKRLGFQLYANEVDQHSWVSILKNERLQGQ
jgi:ribosomal-protein-alanine N-acetyltransferase